MEIIKGENKYIVFEYSNKWSVKLDSGKLGISFDVPKELCENKDELRKYVLSSEMF